MTFPLDSMPVSGSPASGAGASIFLPIFAPAIDLPFRFNANAGRALECAVLRPIDLTRTHGVKVTAEEIAAMAEAYDPAFEAGALNFDHAWGGPAHGLASRIWLDGDLLWCRMEQLSTEAIDGIASGKWPRRSSEFWMSHPQTGQPYWCGLALLGAATPAVPGLPPAVLLSQRPIYRLVSTVAAAAAPISTGATVAPAAPAASQPGETSKEDTMKKKASATPAGAENETPETTPPKTPPAEVEETPQTPTPEGDEAETAGEEAAAEASSPTPVTLAAERAQLRAELEATRAERLAAKKERAEATVDKLFQRLGSRVPPSVVKASRPLLIALASQLTPPTVQLSVSGKDQEVGLYNHLVTVLEALPENRFVGAPPRAEASAEELASVSAEGNDVNSRAGITAERRAQLAAKYPDTYRAPVN